jgi:hypothetical protein
MQISGRPKQAADTTQETTKTAKKKKQQQSLHKAVSFRQQTASALQE